MLLLTKVKRTETGSLCFDWNDGQQSEIPLKKLRDECPCAGCKGETVLFESAPPKLPIFVPGMYDLKKIEIVGNYSLQPTWGDGHQTGLYSFDYLKKLSLPLEHN